MPAAGAAASASAASASPDPALDNPAHATVAPESATKNGPVADQPAKPAAVTSAEPVSSPTTDGRADASGSPTSAPALRTPAHRSAALAPPNEEPRSKAASPAPAPSPGSTHLGLVGPLTWPTAYEDVIGYTLWPQNYGERLRTHGIADVLGAVFVSPATLAAKTRAANAQATVGSGTAAPAACGGTPPATDWPAAEIERAIDLTAAQRTALDQLKATLREATATIAASCRDTADLGPTERLQALQTTLWAVHDAALVIRAPLATFYDSLSDDQKKQFAAAATDSNAANPMSRGEMARMCGMPASLESTMRQIARSLQITKPQNASLDALNKKSFEMGQFLMASCLKPVPATPAERLDAAADRLTAVLFAASTLGPAVNDFYAELSDQQKAKLKTLR